MPTILFLLAIVCSLLSQLPAVLESPVGGVLKLSWIPVGIAVAFTSGRNFIGKPVRPWYLFLALFSFYLLLLSAFTTTDYIGTDYTNMWISMLICVVSYAYWKKYSGIGKTRIIAFVTLVCAIIFTYVLYTQSLQSIDITTKHEIYASKNSAAQIIFACGLVAMICLKPKKLLGKTALITILALFTVIVFMLRSRATIVSYLFVLVYFVLGSPKKWHRVALVGLVVAVILIIISNPEYYNIVVENILFNNRNSDDVNDLSSGRMDIIAGIWDDYLKSPLLGIGIRYVDCFPFAMLIQFGPIGLIIVMAFLAKIFSDTWKVRKYQPIGECAFLLLSSFLVNALFEAQPPFGPGVKCFLVWVFVGFALAEYGKSGRQLQALEDPS